MPQELSRPTILMQATANDGVAFQFRKDSMGLFETPGFPTVIVCAHVGAPAKLACVRDGRRYSGIAAHGDIDIIPPGTPSVWQMKDENDTTVLLSLPRTLLSTIALESGLDPARMEICDRFQIRDKSLEALFWAAKHEMEVGCPSGLLFLDGLALAVASRVVSRHSSIAKRTPERNEGLRGYKLKRVLSFIEEHLTEDISLAEVASVAGISASHLNTLFRISMGVPVHRYMIERRVDRAKMLLKQDNLSMADVAAAVGFAHQSHMARHMRRVLGMPPRIMKRLLSTTSSASA